MLTIDVNTMRQLSLHKYLYGITSIRATQNPTAVALHKREVGQDEAKKCGALAFVGKAALRQQALSTLTQQAFDQLERVARWEAQPRASGRAT